MAIDNHDLQRAFAAACGLPFRDATNPPSVASSVSPAMPHHVAGGAASLPPQAYQPRECNCCDGSGRRQSDNDLCLHCHGLGRTMALRNTEDGGEFLPATLTLLAAHMRAIILNDLELELPELPGWLLDRLALHAFAAERIERATRLQLEAERATIAQLRAELRRANECLEALVVSR